MWCLLTLALPHCESHLSVTGHLRHQNESSASHNIVHVQSAVITHEPSHNELYH